MRLRQIAMGAMAIGLVGVSSVFATAQYFWTVMDADRSSIESLNNLRSEAVQFGPAIGHATLLPAATIDRSDIADHARRQAAALEAIGDPQAAVAIEHLRQIASIVDSLWPSTDTPDSASGASAGRPDAALVAQLRIHYSSLLEALNVLIQQRQSLSDQTFETLVWVVRSSLLLLSGMALLVLALTYRRLSAPLTRIRRGIQAISEGDLNSRIALPGDDELGEVARAIDQMAEQLASKEQELRHSEERFQGIAKATSDALWDWDLSDDSLWWSEGFMHQFGDLGHGACPQLSDWSDRVHPHDRAAAVASLNEFRARGGERWQHSYRFRRADGSYAQVLDRGVLITDSHGKPLRMVGGVTDLSERLQLEEQLRQAQRMDSIGQLTGGVAHDFNNLLTVIQGNAELLAERLIDQPELEALARMIDQASRRGADLTQRLLAFASKQVLEPVAVDINRLVEGMHDLLQRSLGSDVQIKLSLTYGICPAMVDPAQLEGALLNLCINARDAMPQGGRVCISTCEQEHHAQATGAEPDLPSGRYVTLTVADSGSGISPDLLPRVFEPFFTTKERGKGTGLGLSMVYGFVRQSRGQIKMESEPGQGTTIHIHLPCVADIPHRATGTPTPRPQSGRGQAILLVEDEEMVRSYAQAQLEALGYRVLAAADGVQALEILRQRADIDLLFTDVIMPGMGGRELVDAAHELRPELPVLWTSGYSNDALIHDGRLDPGVRLLRKPYRRGELANLIRAALGQE